MKANRIQSLDTARWIAIAMYVAGLVVHPLIGVSVKLAAGPDPAALRIVAPLLLGQGSGSTSPPWCWSDSRSRAPARA